MRTKTHISSSMYGEDIGNDVKIIIRLSAVKSRTHNEYQRRTYGRTVHGLWTAVHAARVQWAKLEWRLLVDPLCRDWTVEAWHS